MGLDRTLLRFVCCFTLTSCLLVSCTDLEKIPDDTLVIGIESEIKNLDIRSSSDANAMAVATLVAQSLSKAGDDFSVEPELSSELRIVDERTYDFVIPPGLTFHDGSPLTVEDIKFTFDDAMRPDSVNAKRYADIESKEILGNTFRIRLKTPKAAFLLDDIGPIKILPRHLAVRPEFSERPIGSGPYRFVKRQSRDLIFERFENYRLQGKEQRTSYRHLIVRALQDPTTRFLSLLGGDVDILFNALNSRRVIESEKISDLKVYRLPGVSLQYLGLNLRLPKFKNKKFRQALAYGLNRDELIEFKQRGLAVPAASILPPHNQFYNSNLKRYDFDFVKAKKLLKESGMEGIEIEIKCSSDRDVTSMLLAVKEQWEKLGLKVTLRSYEFATFFADVKKANFEVFSLRWTGVSDPDLLYKLFHSSQMPPGLNRTGYQNPQIDFLVESARKEMNFQKRKSLYAQAQEILLEELPLIPLWHPDNTVVASAKLQDFKVNPLGGWSTALYSSKISSEKKAHHE